MSMFLEYLRNLNLFPSKENTTTNVYEQYSNKLATRAYLCIFILIIISITIALLLILQTETNIIISPTKDEFEALPDTAQCPCTQLSFSYGFFVSVQVRFHPICSSDFVSDRWINTIFFSLQNESYYVADFRSIGSAHFQVLKSLCQLSSEYVNDTIQSLYSSLFVSSKALDETNLRSTINGRMHDFQLNIPLMFKSRLELVKQLIFSNQLVPALDSTLDLTFREQIEYENYTQISMTIRYMSNEDSSLCSCNSNYNCREQSGIYYRNRTNETVPDYYHELLTEIKGFYAGCTPIHALLQSTFECFYNQTCLNQILEYLPNDKNFSAMSTDETTRFSINSTIQSIVNDLMLEEVTYKISHQNYYDQCKPSVCTSVENVRPSFYYILITIIGLLGGLTLTLQFFIPSIVHYLRNRRLPNQRQRSNLNIQQMIVQYKSYFFQRIIELNLFFNHLIDERSIRSQRYTTRLYIFLLIFSFLIIFIYLLSTKDLSIETINNPDQMNYHHLKKLYFNTLQCSCQNSSQSYENFLSIEPIYHPICSSDFLSTDWMRLMDFFTHLTTVSNLQYSINFLSQFNILKTFCDNAQDTIADARRVFLQTKYISIQLIEEEYFLNEFSSNIEYWKSHTKNRYERMVQLIRECNQGNKLLNNNHNINFLRNLTTNQLYYQPLNYSNCSCDLFGSCSKSIHYTPPAGFGPLILGTPFEIPNFLVGCYPVESLLQSTLECFSNETCLTSLLQAISENILSLDMPMNFSILNISDHEQNQTIESIVKQLMIYSWIEEISYSSYYKTCSPICTYQISQDRSLLIILSTILGVLGGLSTILDILMFIIIRSIEKLPTIRSFKDFFHLIKANNSNQLKLILFLALLLIFYLVSFLTPQIKTISIDKPTINLFENLRLKHSDALQCFCSKVLHQYETFVTTQVDLHPICSSHFMTNEWIRYIFNQTDRKDQLGQHQLLVSFCQLAEKIIQNTVLQFSKTNYISTQLIPSNLFNQTIQMNFEQFQKQDINEFLNMLDLIRQLTGSNMILNMYSTNWKFDTTGINSEYFEFHTSSLNYQQCNCGTSSVCTQVLSENEIIVGCYPLEILLQSTLQCFYQQNCIDSKGNYRSLNSTKMIENQTIEILLENLFIEQYRLEISYEKYFNACSISYCTYSYHGYGNPIDVAVLLIGLYGGLTIVSGWITLAIVKLWRKRQQRIHNIT